MPGAVNITWPQITHQQLFPTEHAQRQKAVSAVITVKEAAFLMAVNAIAGGIKNPRPTRWGLP
jgi:hypothetical protein